MQISMTKIFSRGVSAFLMISSLTVGGVCAGAGHPATEYVEGDVIVEITIDDIPQGFRMNVAPASPESTIKLGGMASHFEFRGVGQQILIATLIDFPFPLSLVASLMPIDPKSEQSLKLKKNVETLVGARQGACQFL